MRNTKARIAKKRAAARLDMLALSDELRTRHVTIEGALIRVAEAIAIVLEANNEE